MEKRRESRVSQSKKSFATSIETLLPLSNNVQWEIKGSEKAYGKRKLLRGWSQSFPNLHGYKVFLSVTF